MTVQKLHTLLGKLIEQGSGRLPICVNKPTFSHNLEGDGCVILNICGVKTEWIPNIDGDGGMKVNKDGSESGRTTAILFGEAGDP